MPRNSERMLQALLEYPTLRDAAQFAGVSESTLFRALQNEAFANAYRDARRELWRSALATLQRSAAKAAEALVSIASNEDLPTSGRVSAARAVIEWSARGVEIEDLEQRLRLLEDILQQSDPKRPVV